MKSLVSNIIFFMACSHSGFVNADYKDDIEHTRLATELGVGMPDGDIIIITQSEAAVGDTDIDTVYLPDGNKAAFSSDTILDLSSAGSGAPSSHATGVGSRLYGDSSIAFGTDTIHAYWADDWLQSGFLNLGSGKPQQSSSRLGNHSWIADISDTGTASNILRRVDWLIATDEFIQIVGVKNTTGTNANTFSAAYNVLAVGKTDGNHSTGSPTVDSTYPSGRTRTEIVAPLKTSSAATPVVAATAALLINAGHTNPTLSTDTTETSTLNRNSDIIYNAERSEVIKAALLAGSDRYTQNTSSTDNIVDYRVTASNQTDNGMDARFGAGQVNVFNSYHIIVAGEQNSSQDGGTGSTGIGGYGFDYDPSFGGDKGSNSAASYTFSTSIDPVILTASLVWHIDIDGGTGSSFSGVATFYDLDLKLYDVTSSQTLLVGSNSTINNSENIWTALSANRDYLLQVIPKSGQSAFEWDYALAWQLVSDLDGDGITDHQDNCPVKSNVSQADANEDGIGDDCDIDNDGVTDVDDNCPVDVNINQVDSDNDGAGDVCDVFPEDAGETLDTDDDGVGDNADAFPFDPNETLDSDGDGVGDNADNCLLVVNANQADSDNDGAGNLCDALPLDPNEILDSDNDGIGDNSDVFPLDSSESIDSDIDGIGDVADNCPVVANANQTNTDTDGQGNACDSDDDADGLSDIAEEAAGTNPLLADTDNDGVRDDVDVFPLDPSESIDSDNDGIGNTADTDDDSDGVIDSNNAFPLDSTRSVAESSSGSGSGGGAVGLLCLSLFGLIGIARRKSA